MFVTLAVLQEVETKDIEIKIAARIVVVVVVATTVIIVMTVVAQNHPLGCLEKTTEMKKTCHQLLKAETKKVQEIMIDHLKVVMTHHLDLDHHKIIIIVVVVVDLPILMINRKNHDKQVVADHHNGEVVVVEEEDPHNQDHHNGEVDHPIPLK